MGLHALQGGCPRLRTRWKWETSNERLIGISLIILITNHRANNMELNQIRSVYWNNNDPPDAPECFRQCQI